MCVRECPGLDPVQQKLPFTQTFFLNNALPSALYSLLERFYLGLDLVIRVNATFQRSLALLASLLANEQQPCPTALLETLCRLFHPNLHPFYPRNLTGVPANQASAAKPRGVAALTGLLSRPPTAGATSAPDFSSITFSEAPVCH